MPKEETDKILKELYLRSLTAVDLEELQIAISNMLDDEQIAKVEKNAQKINDLRNK
ncbi:MAG: hypothetical protein FWF59_04190 [Turicibacter sp.]|nr:hypothetical protein [Turicibacter sp.]